MISDDEIIRKAFYIWQAKERLGMRSTPEQNYYEAKKVLESQEEPKWKRNLININS